MMEGVIEKNGPYFRLKGEELTRFDKVSLRKILPDDVVRYEFEDRCVKVQSIIERKREITIGIVFAKTLSLPLLNPNFLQFIDIRYVTEATFCLVNIQPDGKIEIVKYYSKLQDRGRDREMCHDLFLLSVDHEPFTNLVTKHSNHMYMLNKRIDQRSFQTFNIDPAHSKDFDDAISVDIENNIVYIHIVDINYHLTTKPQLERRAFGLGNTLYLPEGNLNSIPDEFSEIRFSLIEGKDREVITVELRLDYDGNIENYFVYPAVITIKKRYSYETATSELETSLYLRYLSKLLENPVWKHSNNPDVVKRLIINPDSGELERAEPYQSVRANKIIEALMIKTNVIISCHLDLFGVTLERFHETSGASLPTPDLSEADFINRIRRLKRAEYSSGSVGHYALGELRYTHFTSPIRRAFDILVHKALAGTLVENPEGIITYINQRSKLTDDIERLYTKLKLLTYFDTHRDKVYRGEVVSVRETGAQVYIPEFGHRDFLRIINSGLEKGDKIELLVENVVWMDLQVIFSKRC